MNRVRGLACAIALAIALMACKRSNPSPQGAPSASTAPAPSVIANASSGAATSAASSGSSPTPASSAALAAGPHLVTDDCLGCHSEDMIAQQRLTAAQWTKVVTKMHGWGAPLEDEREVKLLTEYLASRYDLAAGPYELPTVTAEEASSALAPQPDGAFATNDPAAASHGATLYKEACAACHGQSGQGDKVGVCLVDRPLLHRATAFAERVRVGRGKMPSFPAFTDAQIASLLVHLRKLAPR